jgi:hypothetical protein
VFNGLMFMLFRLFYQRTLNGIDKGKRCRILICMKTSNFAYCIYSTSTTMHFQELMQSDADFSHWKNMSIQIIFSNSF